MIKAILLKEKKNQYIKFELNYFFIIKENFILSIYVSKIFVGSYIIDFFILTKFIFYFKLYNFMYYINWFKYTTI